ncbi:MAG TPA: hypothetical protein VGO08_15920 [Burkholderiales bacterium]|nr:hypothetical protein [Burkholderiales bacterium]
MNAVPVMAAEMKTAASPGQKYGNRMPATDMITPPTTGMRTP